MSLSPMSLTEITAEAANLSNSAALQLANQVMAGPQIPAVTIPEVAPGIKENIGIIGGLKNQIKSSAQALVSKVTSGSSTKGGEEGLAPSSSELIPEGYTLDSQESPQSPATGWEKVLTIPEEIWEYQLRAHDNDQSGFAEDASSWAGEPLGYLHGESWAESAEIQMAKEAAERREISKLYPQLDTISLATTVPASIGTTDNNPQGKITTTLTSNTEKKEEGKKPSHHSRVFVNTSVKQSSQNLGPLLPRLQGISSVKEKREVACPAGEKLMTMTLTGEGGKSERDFCEDTLISLALKDIIVLKEAHKVMKERVASLESDMTRVLSENQVLTAKIRDLEQRYIPSLKGTKNDGQFHTGQKSIMSEKDDSEEKDEPLVYIHQSDSGRPTEERRRREIQEENNRALREAIEISAREAQERRQKEALAVAKKYNLATFKEERALSTSQDYAGGLGHSRGQEERTRPEHQEMMSKTFSSGPPKKPIGYEKMGIAGRIPIIKRIVGKSFSYADMMKLGRMGWEDMLSTTAKFWNKGAKGEF